MDKKKLINTNIEEQQLLPTPAAIEKEIPASEKGLKTVLQGRQAMRVYFEKPRTTTGWKGLINDPFMNDSFHIEEGIKIARRLLLQITEMGLATATEALDPITPQYLSELICWSAIGARTIESQTHREMASGLSMPIGFKNGTDGNIEVAINAMKSALSSHHFLGIDGQGRISVFKTRGNRYGHVVLRGGKKPNYNAPFFNQRPVFFPESPSASTPALVNGQAAR